MQFVYFTPLHLRPLLPHTSFDAISCSISFPFTKKFSFAISSSSTPLDAQASCNDATTAGGRRRMKNFSSSFSCQVVFIISNFNLTHSVRATTATRRAAPCCNALRCVAYRLQWWRRWRSALWVWQQRTQFNLVQFQQSGLEIYTLYRFVSPFTQELQATKLLRCACIHFSAQYVCVCHILSWRIFVFENLEEEIETSKSRTEPCYKTGKSKTFSRLWWKLKLVWRKRLSRIHTLIHCGMPFHMLPKIGFSFAWTNFWIFSISLSRRKSNCFREIKKISALFFFFSATLWA